MFKKISIILFFAATVGAWHAVPLQGLVFAQQPQTECPPECVTDSLEIVTYYPSPYGLYEELRGDKIIVGDTRGSTIGSTEATLPPSGTITFEPKTSAEIGAGTYYEGSLYYSDDDDKFKYYDGDSWEDVGGGAAYWDILTGNDIYNTNSGNIKLSGNVGIGVGASDTIGARLQVNPEYLGIGLILRKGALGSYAPQTYATPGAYSYKVQSGISSVRVTAYGASGYGASGGVSGGLGGMTQATINVISGENLYIYVGATGGGASDVRRGGTTLDNRIVVAGGGGSGGSRNTVTCSMRGHGGAGGGINGNDGGGGCNACGGSGGTQNGGGTGGCGSYGRGSDGDKGQGGSGSCCSGGRGGDGYYGGGGGGGDNSNGGGGGGGSSYAIASAINISMQSGVNGGDGKVIIEPFFTASNNLMEWQNESGSPMSVVDVNGNLALGSSTANGYKLYVNGSAYVTSGAWTASDLRFKENILPLDNSLDKILNIQPVSFDWNKSGYPDMNFDSSRQIGLVAQEVEKQIPELVHTDINGYKAVAYDKLTAVLVEAVKEQQTQMRNQQKKIEILELKLKELDNKK